MRHVRDTGATVGIRSEVYRGEDGSRSVQGIPWITRGKGRGVREEDIYI